MRVSVEQACYLDSVLKSNKDCLHGVIFMLVYVAAVGECKLFLLAHYYHIISIRLWISHTLQNV